MNNSKSTNPGVKCEVDKCEHYLGGDYCTAAEIKVVSRDSQKAENADCLTFKPCNTCGSSR